MGPVVIYQRMPNGENLEARRIEDEGYWWGTLAELLDEKGRKEYFTFTYDHGDINRRKTGEKINAFTMAYWNSFDSNTENADHADRVFMLPEGTHRHVTYRGKKEVYTLKIEHRRGNKEIR